MIIDDKQIDAEEYFTEKDSIKSTNYFVEHRHDFDAIFEYAKQKGFVTTCNQHGEEESIHFHKVNSVDEIVDQAVAEELFECYDHNGTCYRLTKKGIRRFPH